MKWRDPIKMLLIGLSEKEKRHNQQRVPSAHARLHLEQELTGSLKS
jgi:hypothetical protein